MEGVNFCSEAGLSSSLQCKPAVNNILALFIVVMATLRAGGPAKLKIYMFPISLCSSRKYLVSGEDIFHSPEKEVGVLMAASNISG